MAHQANNIPWSLLASHFRWVPTGSRCCGAADVHPHQKAIPNQGKDINHFVEAFLRNIEEHSICERRKYPDVYEAPEPTDEILDEKCVQKISATVQRWHASTIEEIHRCVTCRVHGKGEQEESTVCQKNIIPDAERKAAAFLRPYTRNNCYKFLEVNQRGFFNLELVKTLLLYGEMDPILRACAQPRVGLKSWQCVRQCACTDPDVGWDQLCETALTAYICLNVLYCFPSTWDEASGKTAETDYRHAKSYQYMLRRCTAWDRTTKVVMYPHRQFFGISDDQFRESRPKIQDRAHWARWANWANKYGYIHQYPYGKMPIEDVLFLEKDVGYRPHSSDMPLVRRILCHKGNLPTELVMEIMELAEYEPKRRLNTPHDPFHPSNRAELGEYLKYCWQILVRCDMMAKALDMKIEWKDLVSSCIVKLWGSKECGHATWYKLQQYDGYEDLPYLFI